MLYRILVRTRAASAASGALACLLALLLSLSLPESAAAGTRPEAFGGAAAGQAGVPDADGCAPSLAPKKSHTTSRPARSCG